MILFSKNWRCVVRTIFLPFFLSLIREMISKRLAECIVLNQEYQKCFHKTKNKLKENPNERQFEFR